MKKVIRVLFFFLLLLPSSLHASTWPLAEGSLFMRTARAVERSYVDPDRVKPRKLLEAALDHISQYVPEILVTHTPKRTLITVGLASKQFSTDSLKNLQNLSRTMSSILAFIDQNHSGDIKKADIEYAAVNGMLAALDPHSGLFTPEIYQEFQVGTKGSFGGLGMVIGVRDGFLTIIAPLEGTPAEIAGLKSHDRIMQIDGISTINMNANEAVKILRGPPKSNVELILERDGRDEPFTVKLTRAIIKIDSVKSALLKQNDRSIGYMKVKNFQQNTANDVKAALKSFRQGDSSLDGLILDFRNNPGGLLDQSIEVADLFLKEGVIVSTVGARGKLLERASASSKGTEANYPIVVLINEGSASASEIVAGALQAHQRALVVGTRSFGKGSVQTVFEVADEHALKLTIAQYLAGGVLKIQLQGVVPDIKLIPAIVDQKRMNLVEDKRFAERDLDHHLEEESELLEQAAISLSYFQPSEEEDLDEASRREYSTKLNLEEDFAASFAFDFLASQKGTGRKQMLQQLPTFLRSVEKKESEKVAKELAKLKVDWRELEGTPPAGRNPLLRVAYQLKQGEKVVRQLEAGKEGLLELTVSNVGTAPFYRLLASTSSDTAFLRNKEFVFGKISPRETKSWSVPIKPSQSLPTQQLSLNVEFFEAAKRTPEGIEMIVPVIGKPSPHFAFSYWLKGKKEKLSNGKALQMILEVTNVGKGSSSEETIASLANKSGPLVFLSQGRAKLGVLKPGEKRQVNFSFSIDKKFSEKEVELELSLLDPGHISSISQELKFQVAGGNISPPAKKRHQAPMIYVSTQELMETSLPSLKLSGELNDDESIRDYVVFVAEKKIMYLPNVTKGAKIPFQVDIPLELGNNLVTIAARDNDGLYGRKTIVIRRVEAPVANL